MRFKKVYIEFKSIKFKNILSYGSNVTEVNFSNGINGIIGKNGFGKSSILDSLSFNLFGQPYRKVKINDLINRHNKSKLWTQSIFIIEGKEYKLTRTLKPTSIKLEVNNEEIDLLSSKRLIQDDINKLLGIDYNLFRQIICLSVNYNKPFLSLSSIEKRDIIESIFNIKVFGEMLKNLKKEQTGLKVQSQINKKSLSILEANLSNSRKQLKSIEATNKTFEIDKKNELININKQLKSLNKEINENKSLMESYSRSKELIVDLDDSQKVLFNENEKEINRITYSINVLKESSENLKNMSSCSLCFSKVDDLHKEKHIKSIISDIEKNNILVSSLLIKNNEIEKRLIEIEKNKNEFSKLENEINKIQYKILFNEKELKRVIEQKTLIENRKLDFDINSFKNNFENNKEEYSILFKKNKDLDEKILMNDSISNIISENGIKAHFFKKLLPVLNTKINYHLDLFEMPIILKFNSLMDEDINDISGKHELSYMGFSEGEKKRIDLAILLSLISTTKTISNWNCNIIFFDELFDSATDNDGLDKFTKTLKSMVVKNSNLCVYIISHRLNDEDFFTKKIEIYKNGIYSRIVSN